LSGIVVLLNGASGSGRAASAARELARIFQAAGRPARIELAPDGEQMRVLARQAVADGCDALVAGGGDGTVNLVASAVAGTSVPLGVIPLGTLNHFSKDLGIPADLEEAVAVVLAGRVRQVDVSEVNGHLFLNNSSIGVYPRLVRLRERYQRWGVSKWIAAFWAMLAVLRRHSFMSVRIIADGQTSVLRTPFVFVGNNRYRMEGFSAGTRDSLSDGHLSLYVMNASGRPSLLWLAWQVLIGRAEQMRELESSDLLEAEIETQRGSIQVSLDGEVITERSPLAYRVRPGALSVLAPDPAV